ncbi:2-oxoacid:acceptor oxidoreductase family protein [bacterium]|nr:2-oxoacid:acceptor oxidoreductase family protein [bacterium]
MPKVREIILTGLRFHGILKISQILAQAAVNERMDVKTAEFTNEPIMSIEMCHIRFGDKVYSPLISKGNCEVFICLEPVSAIEVAADYLSMDGLMIINTSSTLSPATSLEPVLSLFDQLGRTIKLDALELARKAGNVYLANFVMLGALLGSKDPPLKIENITRAIKNIKPPDEIQACLKAIDFGMQSVIKQSNS